MVAADSSFVRYCIEMLIVRYRILRKFLITTSVSQRLALKAATDSRSVKVDILISMIKLLEKYLWRRFFSKNTQAIALKFY